MTDVLPDAVTPPAAAPPPAQPVGGGAAFAAAVRRVARQPRFIVAAVVLAVSAVGLSAATQFLQLHFRKLPVPLPVKSLDDPADGIPGKFGPWVQVSVDEPLNDTLEHELGTKQYVFRDYVDTRIERGAAARFKDKEPKKRAEMVARIQFEHPEAVVRMAVTYYTGLVDTVAHIPDRCYVADGFEPNVYETHQQTFGAYKDGRPRDVSYRFINFDDQTGQGRVARNVAYLFHVNGQYQSDPLQVRYRLQTLTEKYGYYAKVELMTSIDDPDGGKDKDPAKRSAKASAVIDDFLNEALPEIEARLPDWQKVTGGK